MANESIQLTLELEKLCVKWKISRLGVFGSFSKGEENAGSDIDLFVSFFENAQISLLDHVRMQREFELYFDRKVDILSQAALSRMKNELRKKDISDHIKIIYAA